MSPSEQGQIDISKVNLRKNRKNASQTLQKGNALHAKPLTVESFDILDGFFDTVLSVDALPDSVADISLILCKVLARSGDFDVHFLTKYSTFFKSLTTKAWLKLMLMPIKQGSTFATHYFLIDTLSSNADFLKFTVDQAKALPEAEREDFVRDAIHQITSHYRVRMTQQDWDRIFKGLVVGSQGLLHYKPRLEYLINSPKNLDFTFLPAVLDNIDTSIFKLPIQDALSSIENSTANFDSKSHLLRTCLLEVVTFNSVVEDSASKEEKLIAYLNFALSLKANIRNLMAGSIVYFMEEANIDEMPLEKIKLMIKTKSVELFLINKLKASPYDVMVNASTEDTQKTCIDLIAKG